MNSQTRRRHSGHMYAQPKKKVFNPTDHLCPIWCWFCFWETLSKNNEISQKTIKFEGPAVYKCADLWSHRPPEDIQDTCMLHRKRKYLILSTIYALSGADFVFERLSQKIMKSLKKQSSSRGLPFTSAPTSGVTDPRKTFRTHVCSTEKESI